jgi:hypothetical protein
MQENEKRWDRCQKFDYTCDDCMLPWNHYDPPELNDFDLDNEHIKNYTERIQEGDSNPQELASQYTRASVVF